MLVLPPCAISQLAERIERAYLRRRPTLDRGGTQTSVWLAAAAGLVALHRSDPSIPIDPELYVACQLQWVGNRYADPWSDLVHPEASARYRRRVRQITLSLRRELRAELRLIRRRLETGIPIEHILRGASARLSPLSRFIAARRHLGPEAAEAFREPARRQHEACPLYRQACTPLLPPDAYPVHEVLTTFAPGHPTPAFSLN